MDLLEQESASQSDIAYARLFEAVQAGRYRPGDRLREAEVAERLTMGRTPVRDALRRLEAEGIVEHRPRMGAVIRSLTQPEVVELYEMRIVLERTAAELAARHAGTAELAELDDLNTAMGADGLTPQEASRLNANFHRCLFMATRNRFLLDASRGMTNALMLLGPTTLDDVPRIQEVHHQHGAVLDAVRRHDSLAAGAAAALHIETSLRHRLKALRQ
jgi:DNA-binding GntR family transcriptional regulator